ncbi:MAG: hypothetical protein ACOYJZ_04505 [Acutalibacter sp.]
MKHLPVCHAEPPQDKKHKKEGKGSYGKGIVFAVFAVLEKQCGQHFVGCSNAANEQAGNNTECGAKVSILGAPKCDQNVGKRHGKKTQAIINLPIIQEKQSNQIGAHNQHRCHNPAGPPLGDRFAEIDQKKHKAAQKSL